MKKWLLISGMILVVALLTGCLTPKVNVAIKPNPIELTAETLWENDLHIKDIKLQLSTSGFSTSYTIEGGIVAVVDEDGEDVFEPFTFDIGATTIIVPGIKLEEEGPEVSLAPAFDYDGVFAKDSFIEYYDENWKGKELKLSVTIKGKNPTTGTAKIVFE